MKGAISFFLSLTLLFSAVIIYPAGKVTVENGVLNLPGEILFVSGSDTIKKESLEIIKGIAEFMKSNPDVKILRIEGYCASRGDYESNVELSKLRAMSVAKAVIAEGVACRRLFAVGFGSGYPFAADTAKGDRITAVIVSGKFKKPGIMPLHGGGVAAGDTCR